MFQIRVGRRGCWGLKEDKENKMQISLQFILVTNTSHNRFVWNSPVTLNLSILPTSPSPCSGPCLCSFSSSAPGDADPSSCGSCCWGPDNPGVVWVGKDLWGHPVQPPQSLCPQVPHLHGPWTLPGMATSPLPRADCSNAWQPLL